MRAGWKRVLLIFVVKQLVTLVMILAVLRGHVQADEASADQPSDSGASLSMLVMDPLAKELACDCVAGFAQRRYEALAMVLQRKLRRPCTSICGGNLAAYWDDEQRIDVIVGKHADVLAQAKRLGRDVHPLVSLTDRHGKTTFRGLFVVRAGNSARQLEDLAGYRILFGPESCQEKHAAALAKLREAGVAGFKSGSIETAETCTDAANLLLKLGDDDKTAAVISDYARVLLEGCHAIPAGALRVIGKTEPVPFITVFATEDMPPALRSQVRRELLAAKRYAALLKLLESKDGFQPFVLPQEREPHRSGWLDYRGPHRKGLVPRLPETLDLMRTAWTASLQDRGLGGVTATERWVLATDRDPTAGCDYLKVFDAQTGRLVLRARLVRPSAEKPDSKLDYGESIRSSPVIHGDRAYVFDAYGVLFSCPLTPTDAPTQEIVVEGVRTQSMVETFKLPTWGVASTPLLVDDLLVVNVFGTKTSLLALRPNTMQLLWKGPGSGTGYASCIAGTFGGRRQILGYQSASFSGWDVETGSLLWTVRPAVDGDYNVPSPIVVDQHRVLLATENNGTRLYAFDDRGILQTEPTAVNEDVTPDTVTPVAAAGFVYCTSGDTLFRLDLNDGLKTDWTSRDEAFVGHATLLADVDGQRLLVVTYSGELFLFDVSAAVPQLKSRRRPFGLAVDEEIYSHPALVDNRLYLRGTNSLMCVAF